MATLGNVPAEAYTNTVKDSFSGNGSTTAFTMSLPTVTNDVRVVVENVIQDPTVAYSVSGTTLTFTSAPPSGTNNIYVVHLGPAVMTTVPPAEIADATTFASSLTVQGAFTSKGIDDNADAVALTIDSSENVLVGGTNTTPWTLSSGSGNAVIRPEGYAGFAATSAAIELNRIGSDGNIANFRKSGTTVGSIGVDNNTRLYFTNNTGAGLFLSDGSQVEPMSNGTRTDDMMSLGGSVYRFRNAYLSGGVYLGGTGAANKLDDYEEGTWTVTLQNAPGGYSNAGTTIHNIYTKVGNLVTLSGYVELNQASTNSGNAFIVDGLPFAPNTNNAIAGSMICRYGSTDIYMPYMGNNQRIEWYKINNTGNWNLMTYADLSQTNAFSAHFTISYTT